MSKEKWRKCLIDISTTAGPITVEAYRLGDASLAVTRSLTGVSWVSTGWSITQIASGMNMPHPPLLLKTAKAWTEKLLARPDASHWSARLKFGSKPSKRWLVKGGEIWRELLKESA